MRTPWSVVALSALAACTGEGVGFNHQSELVANTRGVELAASGDEAQAGMFGTTCGVDVRSGMIGADIDYPSESEEVVDAGVLEGEHAVLVLSPNTLHVTFPGRYWDADFEDHVQPGVLDAAIFDSGVVSVSDDGTFTWITETSAELATSLDVNVGAGFTVTPGGTVYVSTSEGVSAVTPEGAETISTTPSDIVVWDASVEVLYTAAAGDSWVSGLDADGAVLWTTELAGQVVSLDAMGYHGAAAVMVAHADGTGELVTLDGLTGALTSALPTPSAAERVEISKNGKTMALSLPGRVHFFEVDGDF